MLFLVHAYGARLWLNKSRQPQDLASSESLLYMDAPWWRLWPCLLPWIAAEAVLSVAWLRNAVEGKPSTPQIVLLLLDCLSDAANKLPHQKGD